MQYVSRVKRAAEANTCLYVWRGKTSLTGTEPDNNRSDCVAVCVKLNKIIDERDICLITSIV